MKNHELLDMIGEVNEDYVLSADNNVTRPRFRWKALAACAACAALAVGVYSVWRAAQPRDLPLNGTLALHAYTLVEGGGSGLTTQSDLKAPAGGADALGEDNVIPGGAYVGGDSGYSLEELARIPVGLDPDGAYYEGPMQDVPAQEEALAQYDGLLRGLGLYPEGDLGRGPEWFGGAWIDNGYQPAARLAVAIVEGFRTPELEARIEDWCGGEVVFVDVKYSYAYLESLMDPAVQSLRGTGLASGVGVDQTENCLGVDIYSMSGDSVPDHVLAELARLDPDGDAIWVRVFVGTLSTQEDVVKCPLDVPGANPVDPEARATPIVPPVENAPAPHPTPIDGNDPVPGGITQPARTEDGHDVPGVINELPEAKQPAVIYGAGE